VALNMFYVELKPENNNKDIYEAIHVLGYIVKFEPSHLKRKISQCINRQRYGHTNGFCNQKVRCVKCARYHPISTAHCKVKYVLCEGNHPANYKDCTSLQSSTKQTFPYTTKEGNNN